MKRTFLFFLLFPVYFFAQELPETELLIGYNISQPAGRQPIFDAAQWLLQKEGTDFKMEYGRGICIGARVLEGSFDRGYFGGEILASWKIARSNVVRYFNWHYYRQYRYNRIRSRILDMNLGFLGGIKHFFGGASFDAFLVAIKVQDAEKEEEVKKAKWEKPYTGSEVTTGYTFFVGYRIGNFLEIRAYYQLSNNYLNFSVSALPDKPEVGGILRSYFRKEPVYNPRTMGIMVNFLIKQE